MLAIKADNVTKKFGKKTVLDRVSLDVPSGTIFGVLGPNGAGKTTLLSILGTTLSADSGTVIICGMDAAKDTRKVREVIDICSGYGGAFNYLTAEENLLYYGALRRVDNIREVARDLLKLMGLEEKKDALFDDLSTGMKQRLSLALSLLNRPRVLLLDEPTAGLDPKIANSIRKTIKEVQKRLGMTIILTTHNMYEAEEMCDFIALMKDGRMMAVGTKEEIKKNFGAREVIELKTEKRVDYLEGKDILEIKRHGDITEIYVKNAENSMPGILYKLRNHGIKRVHVREPTLEEIFVKEM